MAQQWPSGGQVVLVLIQRAHAGSLVQLAGGSLNGAPAHGRRVRVQPRSPPWNSDPSTKQSRSTALALAPNQRSRPLPRAVPRSTRNKPSGSREHRWSPAGIAGGARERLRPSAYAPRHVTAVAAPSPPLIGQVAIALALLARWREPPPPPASQHPAPSTQHPTPATNHLCRPHPLSLSSRSPSVPLGLPRSPPSHGRHDGERVFFCSALPRPCNVT